MKKIRTSFQWVRLLLFSLFIAAWSPTMDAEVRSADVFVQDLKGPAACYVGGNWLPLRKRMVLPQGAIIKTGADATVDLLLYSSRTALRLRPNSELRLDKLIRESGAATKTTDTSLTLVSGSLAGAQ